MSDCSITSTDPLLTAAFLFNYNITFNTVIFKILFLQMFPNIFIGRRTVIVWVTCNKYLYPNACANNAMNINQSSLIWIIVHINICVFITLVIKHIYQIYHVFQKSYSVCYARYSKYWSPCIMLWKAFDPNK